MKRINGYEQADTYGNFETLPLGGHICKIVSVKMEPTAYGDVLVIAFDIAEGSKFDEFYKRLFSAKKAKNPDAKWPGTYRQFIPTNDTEDENNQKTLKSFKTLITSIEESNPGYKWNWDEYGLKGKLFGGVFGREQFEARDGRLLFATNCRYIRSIETIKNGVEIPEDKLLKGAPTPFNEPRTSVTDDDEIPF